jgi:hypothetical protein
VADFKREKKRIWEKHVYDPPLFILYLKKREKDCCQTVFFFCFFLIDHLFLPLKEMPEAARDA